MQRTDVNMSESYNSLLGISEANRRIDELGGEDTVGKLLSIIADAGLEKFVGIRLLHKHNDITEAELMVESATTDDEGFALITSATLQRDTGNIACNSWRLAGGRFVPVEYSNQELVQAGFDMSEHSRVFDSLAEAIRVSGVEDVLGPCLNYSSLVAEQSPSENAAFLEKTDTTARSNVVRYVMRDDVAFVNSAKTKWYAKRVVDASEGSAWTTACNCFCSVSPGGGHMGTTTHRYTPSEKDKKKKDQLL